MNLKLLKAHMILIGIDSKTFAKLQNWSMSTCYRKLSGKVLFTVAEIEACIYILKLQTTDVMDIFFKDYLSYKTKDNNKERISK